MPDAKKKPPAPADHSRPYEVASGLYISATPITESLLEEENRTVALQTEQTEQTTPNEGELRREVGLISLLFSSLGAIIGSGWLFGALYPTIEAGPAAIFSWLIAGAIILLLALIHAELGGMFPLTGGTARYPQFAFGSVVSFAAGWIAWVGAVTIAR